MNRTLRKTSAITASAVITVFSCITPAAEAAENEMQKVMAAVKYECDAPNQDTTSDVSVAALPIMSNGAMFAADNQGIFKKHGLQIEFQTVSGLPATITAVQGGAVDIAFTGTVATFQAMDRGIELTFIAPFAGIAPGYWKKMQAGEKGYTREINALLVAPDSAIKTPGDLSGKTVVVGDVKGQSELTTRYVIKKHGGDPDSVKYVVMGFADAVNALMAGQVDAAYSAEPAIVKAEQAGYRIISWPGVETLQEGPTSAFVASTAWVLENPEVAVRFNCAIREATALGRENPDLVRKTTAEKQNIDPAELANAVVPYYYSMLDMKGLQRFYSIEKDAKFITADIDLSSVVIPQAIGN
ncbi:ABC transporter substrate-binding protein [Rhizobium leguminosarum]|uniref:ABC transporter substrate-binding protein n=1 Tax=Rhizobium leguminosarum TaxID=384 RepID=UPI00143F54E2|nr:ABC transporter substrate-binding protein [Rhizobium leguminosarum]NKL21244.1 PhnD/SsuA/transferrin family substrate-binding protein [Rhizobium leguminosarum bv. viciae]NKL56751.1 PhnD/SsuA/transferrin family substrate-binding protein [Rhizobium leguminosarum bv. viciae]